MIKRIIFIAAFICCFCPVYCDNRCPNYCKCRGQLLDYSNRNLQEIPEDIPTGVDTLKLNKNLLYTVPVKTTMNLTCLTLSHNRIVSISRETFEKLPLLEMLDLSANHLPEIKKEMFPNATRLKVLILNNNYIASIENGSLNGLSQLTELKLNRNNLTVLHKETFANVSNLKVLEISRNHLREIIGLSFSGLKNLSLLKIKQNNIDSLLDGAFYGLANLFTLQLDDNKITEVSNSWLYGLDVLNHLSLSHNMIKRMIGGWEFCKHLTELDLSHNELNEIDVDSLHHLSELQILKLNDNLITSISKGAFNHTSSLRLLDLQNNKLSWTFEDTNGVFLGLNKLTKLVLAGNMITSIPPKAFLGLDSLIELNLSGNNLLTLQENAFVSLPSLNVLLINTTSLLCDCTVAWFPLWLGQSSQTSVQVSCGYPNWLKGKHVTQVPADKFICPPDDSPKPVIIEQPSSQVALAASDVLITCTGKSSSETPLIFKWRRNNQEIKEWTATTGGEHKFDLKLCNVNVSDSAKYQCIITNAFGTAYSHKAKLSILVFPEFLKKPSNVTAKAGNTARLECAVTGQPHPQIAWQKDGGKVFPAAQERRMHVMPTDDVFFLVNVKARDSGIYTCTATNTAGSITANASLTVLEAPSFAKNMEDKVTAAGKGIVLECMVSGSPKPNLTWTKDGGPLLMTDRHFFTAEDQLLIITNTMLSDAGTYECEITNSLGSKKDQSRLKILPMYGSDLSDENITMDGAALTHKNITGVIMMTVVCCAVLTSAVWVIIIYHTRRRLRRSNCTPKYL